jgi:hypothetical protein
LRRFFEMSGPIVRKYGFPNFDEIFGKRDLEHGVEGKKAVDPLNREAGEKTDSATKKSESEASEKK